MEERPTTTPAATAAGASSHETDHAVNAASKVGNANIIHIRSPTSFIKAGEFRGNKIADWSGHGECYEARTDISGVVIIPNHIVEIKRGAFERCTHLSGVSTPCMKKHYRDRI